MPGRAIDSTLQDMWSCCSWTGSGAPCRAAPQGDPKAKLHEAIRAGERSSEEALRAKEKPALSAGLLQKATCSPKIPFHALRISALSGSSPLHFTL